MAVRKGYVSPEMEMLRERIRELWDLGMSCAQISKEMGITRNIVIGHCYRMGLRRPKPIRTSSEIQVPKRPPGRPKKERPPEAPKVKVEVSKRVPVKTHYNPPPTLRRAPPEVSKEELRRQLAQAVMNTRALTEQSES